LAFLGALRHTGHSASVRAVLLAVEAGKASNHRPPEHDQHKLHALTDPHLWSAYWIGAYLVLGKKSVLSDVYVVGVIDKPLSGWLAGPLKDVRLGVG
jgi:hypothetical protein